MYYLFKSDKRKVICENKSKTMMYYFYYISDSD